MISKEQMIDILNELSIKKDEKPYLSEAQFQFELAWEIQKKFKNVKVLLEYTACSQEINGKRKRFESDIIVQFENNTYIAIELKYKTTEAIVNGIPLIQQAGQPGTKYDYLWDIHRIELLHQKDEDHYEYHLEGTCIGGYAIFLTNDSSYWGESEGTAYNFRLCNKRTITPNDNICWNVSLDKKKAWMSRESFNLFESYCFNWESYITYDYKNKLKEFKYLLTPIGDCKK